MRVRQTIRALNSISNLHQRAAKSTISRQIHKT